MSGFTTIYASSSFQRRGNMVSSAKLDSDAFDQKNPIDSLKQILNNQRELATVHIFRQTLYAGVLGRFYIYLIRENTIFPLFEPTLKAKTGSGFLKKGDRILIFSEDTKNAIDQTLETQDWREITAAMEKKSLEGAVLAISGGQRINVNWLGKINFNLHLLPRIIILAIFITGAVFLSQSLWKLQNQTKQKFQQEALQIQSIQKTILSAKELVSLNNVRATDLAEKALTQINATNLDKITSKENRDKILTLKKDVEKIIADAQSVVQSEAEKVWSTSLLKKNSAITDIAIQKNQTAVLDQKNQLLFLVNIPSKKTEIVDLKKYSPSPTKVAADKDYIFVFDSSKILRINPLDKKAQTVITADAEWGNVVEMFPFSENLYLLDDKTPQIWKYLGEGDSYSEIKKYFSLPYEEKPISFGIDKSIYVLENNQRLTQYLSGVKQAFELILPQGEKISGATKVIVNPDLENIYLLEPIKKRVMIFNKKGEYTSQLVDNLLSEAKTFAVDEVAGAVYFPLKDSLYKITLQ